MAAFDLLHAVEYLQFDPPQIMARGQDILSHSRVLDYTPPPDLDCKDTPYKRFNALQPDPHHFDSDNDGIG